MRIAIANAPTAAVESLRLALSLAPEHNLVWSVTGSAEAVRMCAEDVPDLLLMGLPMSVSEVVDCTKRIMKNTPCPILVAAVNYQRQISEVFQVFGAGALDVVNVPATDNAEDALELLRKIDAVRKRIASSVHGRDRIIKNLTGREKNLPPLIVIGASTGGPNAIATILAALPNGFHAAILVVQHVDEQFAEGIAHWFGQHSKLLVDIARVGDRPLAGHVLIASTNDHMVLTTDRTIAYTVEPVDYPYRPSVDVFFASVAQNWPKPSAAVLLTGMGRDGASGLMALRGVGWHTIAQDKESCAVYGMPKAAIELGAAKLILPLSQIAEELKHYEKSKPSGQARG